MATLDIAGGSIRYERAGAGEQWLVLLHEIGGSLESWAATMPGLARRFTVVAYDQRGAGGSSAFAPPLTIDTQAEDIGLVLDALGQRGAVHLAGVAIGAALVVRFAARHPGRVKSLVLACPAPGVSADRVKYLGERAAQVEREGMGATVENSLGNSWPDELRGDRAVFDAYRARFLANDPKSYAAINRAFASFDAVPDLAAIRCPTLVLAGRHDKLRPPAFVEGVAAKIPGARYKVLDSGHIMPMQAPAAMAEAMVAFYAANP